MIVILSLSESEKLVFDLGTHLSTLFLLLIFFWFSCVVWVELLCVVECMKLGIVCLFNNVDLCE